MGFNSAFKVLKLHHSYTSYLSCNEISSSFQNLCAILWLLNSPMDPKWGTRDISPFPVTGTFTGHLHGNSHEPEAVVASFISLPGVNTMARGRKEHSDVRALTTAPVHSTYFHSLGIVPD